MRELRKWLFLLFSLLVFITLFVLPVLQKAAFTAASGLPRAGAAAGYLTDGQRARLLEEELLALLGPQIQLAVKEHCGAAALVQNACVTGIKAESGAASLTVSADVSADGTTRRDTMVFTLHDDGRAELAAYSRG